MNRETTSPHLPIELKNWAKYDMIIPNLLNLKVLLDHFGGKFSPYIRGDQRNLTGLREFRSLEFCLKSNSPIKTLRSNIVGAASIGFSLIHGESYKKNRSKIHPSDQLHTVDGSEIRLTS